MSMEKPTSTLPCYLWLQAAMVSLKPHIPRRKHGSGAQLMGTKTEKKTQLPRPRAAGSLGRKLLSWFSMTTSKVKAEVSRVLFTDGETEAQNEPGWGGRSLAFVSVGGMADTVSNPKGSVYFLYCVPQLSTQHWLARWGWGPLRINSVQEPRRKAPQVKFGRAQALDK